MKPAGVLHTDRCVAYGHLPAEQRSCCWAHLVREFQAMNGRRGTDGVVGRRLLDGAGHILGLWHNLSGRDPVGGAFLTALELAQEELRVPLACGEETVPAVPRTLCQHLRKRWDYLWTWARAAVRRADAQPGGTGPTEGSTGAKEQVWA